MTTHARVVEQAFREAIQGATNRIQRFSEVSMRTPFTVQAVADAFDALPFSAYATLRDMTVLSDAACRAGLPLSDVARLLWMSDDPRALLDEMRQL